MLSKKGAIHEKRLAVAVTILREDVENDLVDFNGSKVLWDGTPLIAKDSKDFRKDGKNAKVSKNAGTKIGGILVDPIEFKQDTKQVTATVMLEGVIYIDVIKQPTITATDLPNTITYLYKDRK